MYQVAIRFWILCLIIILLLCMRSNSQQKQIGWKLVIFTLLTICCFGSKSQSCSSSYIPCGPPATTILSRSGLKSTIIAPGTTRQAVKSATKFPKHFLDKNAIWIWDSDGADENCNMSIVISDTFYEKCPGQGITIQVAAESHFILDVLGETKTTKGNPPKPFTYTFSTAGRSCNSPITMTINASKESKSGKPKCKGNPAGLTWSVSGADTCGCTTTGHYYDWATCSCRPCLNALPGCVTCKSNASLVTCKGCSTSKRWVLNTTSQTCQCESGRVRMTGCLSCISPGASCSDCDTDNNFVSSGGNCVCKTGYALLNGECVTCISQMPHCLTCSSATHCTSCTPFLYQAVSGSCQSCSSLLTNCVTCSSSTHCLTCNSPGLVPVGGSCSSCGSQITGCQTCFGPFICLSCNTGANFVRKLAGCGCSSGFGLVGTSCNSCGSIVTGCTKCSGSTCQTCSSAGNFMTDGSGGCTCKANFVISGSSCVACGTAMPGCTACSAGSVCTACNSALNLIPSGSSCVCATNYVNVSSSCVTCGTAMANCLTCTGIGACTSCSAGFYVSGGSCSPCSTYHAQCTSCTTSACTGCNTANFFFFNGATCVCNTPYAVSDGSGGCLSCASSIPGCSSCTTLASCDVCATGFIDNGIGGCSTCSALMTNCGECTSFATCTGCVDGYALGADCLSPCSATMPGCTKCSDSTTCTQCDSTLFLAVDAFSLCSCQPGYFNNSGTCTPCSTPMPGCKLCSSGIFCTQCDSALFLVASAGSCVCQTDYALDTLLNCVTCPTVITDCVHCSSNTTCTSCTTGNGMETVGASVVCTACATLITHCQECVDETACQLCDTGFTPNGAICEACGTAIDASCAECSSTSVCTLCVSDTYFLNASSNLCQVCSDYMPGCLTCDSDTVCTDCDFANDFIPSGTSCTCVSPKVLNSTSKACITCGAALTGCELCSDQNTCTGCGDGYFLTSPTCTQCAPQCTTCTSLSVCGSCDATLHYSLSGTTCVCSLGYVPPASGVACVSLCGDGIMITADEQCDDGNLVSGDGCSSTCTIESDFECFTFPMEPTKCSYSKPLQVEIQSITKDPNRNSLSMNIQLGPVMPNLADLNFSTLIRASVPLLNPVFTLSPTGLLTISYDYNQTLQGQQVRVSVDPASYSEQFFATPKTVVFVNMTTSEDNLPLTYYNETTYENVEKYDKAWKGGVGSAYVVAAIGAVCDKVAGVELFGAWQVAFFSLSNINKVQPLLSPLMNLKIVNGINSQIDPTSSAVPDRVRSIGYEADFLANMNYMLWLIMVDVALGLIVYGVGALVPAKKEVIQNVGKRILKEYLLMIVLFNTFNIAYSAGLQFTYNSDSVVDMVFAAVALLAPLTLAFTVTLLSPVQYGEFKSHFRPNRTSQSYNVYTILYRTALGVCMSQMNEIEQATIINFFIGTVFTVFLLSNVPFVKGYQNYRAIIAQMSIMLSLFIAMYYRSMKSTTAVEIASQILEPAKMQLAVLFLATAVTAGTVGYEMYLKFKPIPEEIPKEGQHTQAKINDTEADLNIDPAISAKARESMFALEN